MIINTGSDKKNRIGSYKIKDTMENRNKIKRMLIIISLLLMTSTTFAQLPGFTPEQNDAKPAPISSIVALGLIAGAVYGMRKIKR